MSQLLLPLNRNIRCPEAVHDMKEHGMVYRNNGCIYQYTGDHDNGDRDLEIPCSTFSVYDATTGKWKESMWLYKLPVDGWEPIV